METPSEILKLHSQWLEVCPLPEENHQALWKWIRMRFNHTSNHFEGNTLTYSETQLLLIHGRASGDHKLREYEEMKAHNVAFKHMVRLAREERPISEGDIRDFNKICLKEPFYKMAQTPDGETTRKKIIPGQYKTQPNHVLTETGELFQFALPEETPMLMAELVKWMEGWLKQSLEKQHKSLISFLAELHKRFILIHPFDDGNGRVVRLLMNYILVRLNFLPIILNDRKEYIKAIQFSDAGDKKPLESLLAANISMMLKKGLFARENKINLDEPLTESE